MQSTNSLYAKISLPFGCMALFLWSLSPVFTSLVKRIPTFEITFIALGTSFFLTLIFLTINKRWHQLKQSLVLWIIGILGIFGNDVFYITAFKYAPPAQVDLINYLWPIFTIIFASFIPKEKKLTIQQLLAGCIAFFGIYLVIMDTPSGFKIEYLPGYIFALADALIWSFYIVLSRHYGKTPIEMIGMYCGFGMLFSIIFHFSLEPTIIPSLTELTIMITMGFTTQGAAYFLWDFAIKNSKDLRFLSLLSYSTPILSIILLIICGLSQPTIKLLIACILVTIGGLIGCIQWPSFATIMYRLNKMLLPKRFKEPSYLSR